MSTNLEYVPFAPLEGIYESTDKALLLERALRGMQQLIGMNKTGFDTLFKDVIEDVFDSEYPNFRCSTFRAIMEGRLGIAPVDVIPPKCRKQVEQILTALDVLETVVCKWLENKIDQYGPQVRSDAKALATTHGSVKLPRLFEALYALPEIPVPKKSGKPKQNKKQVRV